MAEKLKTQKEKIAPFQIIEPPSWVKKERVVSEEDTLFINRMRITIQRLPVGRGVVFKRNQKVLFNRIKKEFPSMVFRNTIKDKNNPNSDVFALRKKDIPI